LSQDTANTLSVVDLLDGRDEDITIRTPGSTPRVLDDESFQDSDLLVTDSQDSMIEVSTTTGSENTRLVELEGVLIGFDEDRDGEVNQSRLELVSALGGDELVVSVDLVSLGGIETALTVLGSVGVVRFEFKTVLGGILNSEIRPASLATITSSRSTINDLLFREREEFTAVDEVETFEDTSGGESPARTALALILNGGNGTLVSPIDGVGESINGKASSEGVSGNFLSVVFEVSTGSIDLLEFGSSQISKLVDGELDFGVFRVHSVDLVEVFNEDTESDGFFFSSIGFLVLNLPGRPHRGKGISLESSADNTSESEKSNKKDNFVHF
jgi:hypothetical protein